MTQSLPVTFILYYTQFTGGMFTIISPTEARRVYFEGSEPARPVMRVAKDPTDEDTVTSSYAWDRGDLCTQTHEL